ncbi:BMC domain-containing protein [Salisediminibacterium selenitireducens]|uniref:Microcompartments protein n=1 Tax=Bacillus selenitireducens (strain ATCC 700615 / DSM 15326 / MLS10) TaxID=439292 RepID=D6Y0M9_BACIE|nr:BMC domain-containing protein [Salisediminibacterium selenitireducens]ADI00597.1 microcompartments protein [[Bacillus] selenitireducens MLS10]
MTVRSGDSYGFVEVRQYTEAMMLLDHMLKMTYVELVSIERAGAAHLTLIVKGELASVQLAMEEALNRASSNEVTARVIAKPYEGFDRVYKAQSDHKTKRGDDGDS